MLSVRSSDAVVCGLDLSLASTGLARITRAGESLVVDTERLQTKLRGLDRLDFVVDQILQFCRTADLVVVEGPSYNSRVGSQQGHHERAGMWWMVRHGLWKLQTPVAVCPPMVRAKYAAGKGTAGKDEVLAAVIRRYGLPLEVDITGNDVADALTMAAMGWRWLGAPVEDKIPQVNAECVQKVAWPD